MDLSLGFRYNVLILDDDTDYSARLKKEIEKASKNLPFEIAVTTAQTSRKILLLSDCNYYDAYIIDFCYKGNDPAGYSDFVQYQGLDLYDQLQFDKYDELHREKHVKIFYLSSLDSKLVQEYCNFAPASYFCKREKNLSDIASNIVLFFDGHYHAEYANYSSSFEKYCQSVANDHQKANIQNNRKLPTKSTSRGKKVKRIQNASTKQSAPCNNINNSLIIAAGNDIDLKDFIARENKQTVFRREISKSDFARHVHAIEDAAKNGIPVSDSKKLRDSLLQLKQEVASPAPRPKKIDRILSGIRVIKGSTEFAAAVAAIVEFFSKLTLPI